MSKFNNQPKLALDYLSQLNSRITQVDREGGLTREEHNAVIEAEEVIGIGIQEWIVLKGEYKKLKEEHDKLAKELEHRKNSNEPDPRAMKAAKSQ
jgi:hypothetical protein